MNQNYKIYNKYSFVILDKSLMKNMINEIINFAVKFKYPFL